MKNNDNKDTIIMIVVLILIASFICFMIRDWLIVVGCPAPSH